MRLRMQEVKRFGRQLGLACVAVFGGSGVANQISELKRGAEVCEAEHCMSSLTTLLSPHGVLACWWMEEEGTTYRAALSPSGSPISLPPTS
jgi:hypothetical protein